MKSKFFKTISPPLIVCGLFIICAVLGMLINPAAFGKLFSLSPIIETIPEGYYWDTQHYASLALKGICTAFYPLWPLIIRTFFHPQTIQEAAGYLILLGNILFFISVFALYLVFEKAFNQRYSAFICVLAYGLSPMSIFHSIGYTESLFSLLSIVFMWAFIGTKHFNIKIFILFCITLIMSLTRPILIQVLFASSASMITILIWRIMAIDEVSLDQYKQSIKITITLVVSAILGYSLYGLFCLQTRGDFLAPFNDQKHWGKGLGLHLASLFTPRATFFDLLGFYFSLLILILSLIFVYFKLKNKQLYIFIPKSNFWNFLMLYPPLLIILYIFYFLRRKKRKIGLTQLKLTEYTKTLSENYLFWFCIYFTVAHSIIVFLTDNYLTSVGRFVFAVPFLFMALGYLGRCIPGKKQYRPLLWLILFSGIALVRQWVLYGQDKWIG